MKAVVSTTYDDIYLWNLPLICYLWNRLGVDVICFCPKGLVEYDKYTKHSLVIDCIKENNLKCEFHYFYSPEHKEATYAQCSRLYAACLDLPEDEILITSDADMGVFKKIWDDIPQEFPHFYIIGDDLTPDKQYPICYAYARTATWRSAFDLDGKTYQQCLDDLLGDLDAEHFRGNYWGKDQETLYNKVSRCMPILIPRARPGTQFAANRVDRDDINWRAYVNDDLVDAHLWRPGYTDENFANIMELLTMKYPNEDFTWLRTYNEQYKNLL